MRKGYVGIILIIGLSFLFVGCGVAEELAQEAVSTETHDSPDTAHSPDENRWIRRPIVSDKTQWIILENPVLDSLTTSFSAQRFIEGDVSRYEIEAILLSGMRAQSAGNAQPWRFTVITNWDDVSQMHRDAAYGNVVIIVSGRIHNRFPTVDFDSGVAMAYMQLAAESLGLGARILGFPVPTIEERRDDFDIPNGYRVIMALLVGQADDAIDGFATASPRNTLGNLVNWAE